MDKRDVNKLHKKIRQHTQAQIDLSWAGTGSSKDYEVLQANADLIKKDLFRLIHNLCKKYPSLHKGAVDNCVDIPTD